MVLKRTVGFNSTFRSVCSDCLLEQNVYIHGIWINHRFTTAKAHKKAKQTKLCQCTYCFVIPVQDLDSMYRIQSQWIFSFCSKQIFINIVTNYLQNNEKEKCFSMEFFWTEIIWIDFCHCRGMILKIAVKWKYTFGNHSENYWQQTNFWLDAYSSIW